MESRMKSPLTNLPFKLPLVTASVVAYTVLTMAWICYAELVLP
jgi:hypothetical protein